MSVSLTRGNVLALSRGVVGVDRQARLDCDVGVSRQTPAFLPRVVAKVIRMRLPVLSPEVGERLPRRAVGGVSTRSSAPGSEDSSTQIGITQAVGAPRIAGCTARDPGRCSSSRRRHVLARGVHQIALDDAVIARRGFACLRAPGRWGHGAIRDFASSRRERALADANRKDGRRQDDADAGADANHVRPMSTFGSGRISEVFLGRACEM